MKSSTRYTTSQTSESQPLSRGLWHEHNSRSQAVSSARALGYWLPIISAALRRATGVDDWNIVQNNGARAAQVVPHVHFHFIPRYQEGRTPTDRNGKLLGGSMKSWVMFGRGQRDDLSEEEGEEMAAKLRRLCERSLLMWMWVWREVCRRAEKASCEVGSHRGFESTRTCTLRIA